MMGNLTSIVIVAAAFGIAFGITRAVLAVRSRRAAKRQEIHAARMQLEKSLLPPSKNKNKRRREQQLRNKGRKA